MCCYVVACGCQCQPVLRGPIRANSHQCSRRRNWQAQPQSRSLYPVGRGTASWAAGLAASLLGGGRSALDPPETFPGSPFFWGLLWIPVHIGVLPGSPPVCGPAFAVLGFASRKSAFSGSPGKKAPSPDPPLTSFPYRATGCSMEAEEGTCSGVESADEHVSDEDDTASSAICGAASSSAGARKRKRDNRGGKGDGRKRGEASDPVRIWTSLMAGVRG